MSKIQLIIKNYKLAKDWAIELEHGYLYFVKGKGNKGKSSIIKMLNSLLTANDTTINPITYGEEEAEGKLINWKTEDAKLVSVTRKLRTDSKDIYTMEIDGRKVRSVTEIRDTFNHFDFDVVDFCNLSLNQQGRDKQREIILNLLSIEEKKKLFKFEDLEELAANIRKGNKKELASAKTLLKNNTLTKEETKLLAQKENAEKMLKELKEEVAETALIEEKIKNINQSITSVNNSLNQAKEGLEEGFVVMLEEVRKKIEDKYNSDLESLPKIDEISLREKQERIEKGEAVLDNIKALEIKQSKFKDYSEEVEKYTSIVENNETRIQCLREAKNKYMTTVSLPIPNLIIGSREEGLFINTEHGILPFREDQLSRTSIYRIGLQILAAINKTSKVITIGNPAKMDDDFKQEIALFAKENNLLIFSDEVTNDDEVSIEIVELKESIKTTTKSKPKVKKVIKQKEEVKEKEKKQDNNTPEQLLF